VTAPFAGRSSAYGIRRRDALSSTADPVALLYAGSDQDTVANPVGPVLRFFASGGNAMTFVGGSAHSALAAFLLVSAIQDVVPGYWREPRFQLEMLFVVLVYPAIVPAFAVCGGLHDRCTTALGHVTQVVALGASLSGYLLGWWVLASRLLRSFRRHRGLGAEHA